MSSLDTAPTLTNPVAQDCAVAAVLFDLDGTLYDQRRLRRRMAMELALLPFREPRRAARVLRGLRAYRRAQETLRAMPSGHELVSDAQFAEASRVSGVPDAELRSVVNEWMLERPLRHLVPCRAPGLLELLSFLNASNVSVGVLSDYRVEAKLRALGIADAFSLVLCATDPDINALKPHPRGFLTAAKHWGIDPAQILVVGDRVDTDAAGARAAGMPCVIVSRSTTAPEHRDGVLMLSSLERLHSVLDGR